MHLSALLYTSVPPPLLVCYVCVYLPSHHGWMEEEEEEEGKPEVE